MHFAEFGVVMMLFLIGLELRPSILWRSRGPIFGLGGAQVIVIGRYPSSNALRYIARLGLREIFTAAALLLVVGIAILMNTVGLSPALGAFVAGVVLSDSEYRHGLEGDIEPFKGLLLRLFFVSVGASIDFGYVMQNLGLVSLLLLVLIVIKAGVLWGLPLTSKSSADQGSLLALALAQGGEFAFVLVSFCTQQGVLPEEAAKPLVANVALSMACASLLFLLHERVLAPRLSATQTVKVGADEIDETNPVIIAGFGRFGNAIGGFLHAQGVGTTVLEIDPDHVDLLRWIGLKVFYGDATRLDLLHAVGLPRRNC